MAKKSIIAIVILIVAFVLGILLGIKINRNNSGTKNIGPDTFQAGWDAAKKRLSESEFGMLGAPGNAEIKTVSGKVEKVSGNTATIKITPLEILADPNLDTRAIEIRNDTKIYQFVKRDQVQYQKELDAFNKQMNEFINPKTPPERIGEPIAPPEMFEKKEAKLSDIQAGQQITVVAGENIKDSKTIKAVEITIQPESAIFPTGNIPAQTGPAGGLSEKLSI
jgi:hypothetical protein